jgi:SH3 domain protein
VNTKITLTFLLLIFSALVNAKTVYVTDNMTFNVKVDDDDNSALLTTVTSGTPLTLLSKKRSSEYAKVRLASGQMGFILNSYLSPQPASKWYLEQSSQELTKLRQEHARVELELLTIKKRGATAITEALTHERDKLAADLAQLRLISADAVAVRKQRDTLQEDFIRVNKEYEQLKLEKKTLETNANQDWFMYGGLLSLFGVLLGYILPKLSWRKKSHNWDTF